MRGKDKFLVTGGAGFIGSHIVAALVKQGHYVRILDNFSSGSLSNLKGLEKNIDLVKGDICNPGTCIKATKKIDFVLHQAALRNVSKSMLCPHTYNRVNIDGTLNMLEACRQNKIKRFVLASSSSVYGEVDSYPQKESFAPGPISPYALSKLTSEYYCQIFSLYYGLPTIALRYFNVFGPGQALDDEYAVVIPKFINCLLKNQSPPIFGDGRQSRDFTFVQNVVSANLLAVKANKVKSGVFNIALGENTSVLGLAKILNKILGKDIPPKMLPKRPGDIFKSLADISKAARLLNYKPQINFIEGLKITVDFWKNHA